VQGQKRFLGGGCWGGGRKPCNSKTNAQANPRIWATSEEKEKKTSTENSDENVPRGGKEGEPFNNLTARARKSVRGGESEACCTDQVATPYERWSSNGEILDIDVTYFLKGKVGNSGRRGGTVESHPEYRGWGIARKDEKGGQHEEGAQKGFHHVGWPMMTEPQRTDTSGLDSGNRREKKTTIRRWGRREGQQRGNVY